MRVFLLSGWIVGSALDGNVPGRGSMRHGLERHATPARLEFQQCFDAFDPQTRGEALHEREVGPADEVHVLTGQRAEGTVAEDEAGVSLRPGLEAVLLQDRRRRLEQSLAPGARPLPPPSPPPPRAPHTPFPTP